MIWTRPHAYYICVVTSDSTEKENIYFKGVTFKKFFLTLEILASLKPRLQPMFKNGV